MSPHFRLLLPAVLALSVAGCSSNSSPTAATPTRLTMPEPSSAYSMAQNYGYTPIRPSTTPSAGTSPSSSIVPTLPPDQVVTDTFTAGSGSHTVFVVVSGPANNTGNFPPASPTSSRRPTAPLVHITATAGAPSKVPVVVRPTARPLPAPSRTYIPSPRPRPTLTGTPAPTPSVTFTPPSTLGPTPTVQPSDWPSYLSPTPTPTASRPLPSFPTWISGADLNLTSDTPDVWLIPTAPAGAVFDHSAAEGTSAIGFHYTITTTVQAVPDQSIEQSSLNAASVDYENLRTSLIAAGFTEVMSRAYVQAAPGGCPAGEVVGGWARDNQRLMVLTVRSPATCTAPGSNAVVLLLTGSTP